MFFGRISQLMDIVSLAHRHTTKTIIKIKECQGAWTANNKRGDKTKWDYLLEAIQGWPYLFDVPVGAKAPRLDIDLEKLNGAVRRRG